MSRSSLRVEQDELRVRMRATGMSHDEIAVEFARRYKLRPRSAHRIVHGWTQQQAADRINAHAARTGLDPHGTASMTTPWLSEVENWPLPSSRRRPTPQLLARLAEVYGTDIHSLIDLDDREQMPPADLLLIAATRRDFRSAPPLSPAEPAATDSSPADRPGALAGPAFGSGPSRAMPGRLRREEPAGNAERVDALGRREFALLAGSALVLRRAVQSVEITRQSASDQRVHPELVEQLRRRTARLRQLDDILGGGDTYDLYLAEYSATADLARTGTLTASLRTTLRSLLGEQAQQAGWAAFDAGRHADAHRLFRESHEHALAAGDRALAANALAHLAYQATGNDKQAAVTMATAACQAVDAETPGTVRALLHGRLAWAQAISGDSRETERALSLASAALTEDDERPGPGWAGWINGDEIERAAEVVGRVLDVAAGVSSVRPHERAKVILRRLDQHRSLPRVRETFEQAAAVGLG